MANNIFTKKRNENPADWDMQERLDNLMHHARKLGFQFDRYNMQTNHNDRRNAFWDLNANGGMGGEVYDGPSTTRIDCNLTHYGDPVAEELLDKKDVKNLVSGCQTINEAREKLGLCLLSPAEQLRPVTMGTSFSADFQDKIQELQDVFIQWGQLSEFDLGLDTSTLINLGMDFQANCGNYQPPPHHGYGCGEFNFIGSGGQINLKDKYAYSTLPTPAPEVTKENIPQVLAEIVKVQKTKPKRKKKRKVNIEIKEGEVAIINKERKVVR